MDVNSIAALSTSLSMAQTQEAASMAVLKKAMEQQGSAVLPLIDAATGGRIAASNPPNLGQNVDVFA